MADGGEGFSLALKHYLQTQTICTKACDPYGRQIMATYEWQPENKIAIIELAAASGLTVIKKRERNPLKTTTRGTGLLIRHAIDKGAKKIYLGLGGSATNDGGLGIAYSLGFRCKDSTGKLLAPVGEQLSRIHTIIPPVRIPEIRFTICCDVTNPLIGKNGAAYVFAPQKGARNAEVEFLDKGLRNLSRQIKAHKGISISNVKGMGAAGGAMAFLFSYFPCSVKLGADILIRESRIEQAIRKSDLLITGEGCIDEQSLQGKAISRLITLAQEHHCPVMLVCGQNKLHSGRHKKWRSIPVLDLSAAAGSVAYSKRRTIPLLTRHTKEFFINKVSSFNQRVK